MYNDFFRKVHGVENPQRTHRHVSKLLTAIDKLFFMEVLKNKPFHSATGKVV